MIEAKTITSSGSVATQAGTTVRIASVDEKIADLNRYNIDTHITSGGDLWIRPTWQIAVKGPLTPEEAESYRQQHDQVALPLTAESLNWVSNSLDRLQAQYAGQWIAVLQEHVVASAPTIPELLDVLRGQSIEGAFITQIPDKPVVWEFLF